MGFFIYKTMEYKGKLYGKIGNKYFDTGETTDDWDRLESKVDKLGAEVKNMIEKADGKIIPRCECQECDPVEIKICTNCDGYVE